MKDTRVGFSASVRVFRPKWQVRFDDGIVFPAVFRGVHLGTVAEQKTSSGTKQSWKNKKPFNPEWDILFIDNYVFEYCEQPDATITYDVEDGLPETLDSLQNVAIDASSLSMDGNDVWYKKLRFILLNFPAVKRITIIASVVVDIASPECMPQPMYHMDIQNISVDDRIRHGILFGDDHSVFPYCKETLRPSDFAIRAWNDLPNHWPTWKKRKEERTTPSIFMTAVVYFKKEWISLDGAGGSETPCKLGGRRVDVAGTMVREELKKQSMDRVCESSPKKQKSLFLLPTREK